MVFQILKKIHLLNPVESFLVVNNYNNAMKIYKTVFLYTSFKNDVIYLGPS